MAKEKPKQPVNFIDLRQPARVKQGLLIQDVWNSASAKRFRLLPKGWKLGIIVAVTLIIFSAIAGIRATDHHTYYFPESIRKSAQFQLYYPTKLPQGWSVKPDSIKGNSQAVLYTVVDRQGRKFFVSIQVLPANFNYEAFKKKFSDTDETLTNIGSVLTGDAGYALVGSIRTADNSWILINAPDTTVGSEIEALARTFEKAD